jgi:DNA-binding Lrp family transcriptional regulator
VYFLAGADDFHVHVAAQDPDDLRAFVVDNLSSAPEVALTETNLIFEHKRGRLAE